tara:strand:- start:11961 stop:16118 length:4158 start_codon:yes stop_codon:yes gene_type:complete
MATLPKLSKYEYSSVYKWFEGGCQSGQQPSPRAYLGYEIGVVVGTSHKFWRNDQITEPAAIVDPKKYHPWLLRVVALEEQVRLDGNLPFAGAISEDFVRNYWDKAMPAPWSNTPYDSLDGTWFETTFGYGPDMKAMHEVYSGLSITPADSWNSFTKEQKKEIIFWLMFAQQRVPSDNTGKGVYKLTIDSNNSLVNAQPFHPVRKTSFTNYMQWPLGSMSLSRGEIFSYVEDYESRNKWHDTGNWGQTTQAGSSVTQPAVYSSGLPSSSTLLFNLGARNNPITIESAMGLNSAGYLLEIGYVWNNGDFKNGEYVVGAAPGKLIVTHKLAASISNAFFGIAIQDDDHLHIYRSLQDQPGLLDGGIGSPAFEVEDGGWNLGKGRNESPGNANQLKQILQKEAKDQRQRNANANSNANAGSGTPDGDIYKKLEQCILLSAVPVFDKIGREQYHNDYRNTLTSSKTPHGGRVMGYATNPLNTFMNWANATNDLHDFTQDYGAGDANTVDFNYELCVVRQKEVNGVDVELELPIMFAGQLNQSDFLLRRDKTFGKFKQVTTYGVGFGKATEVTKQKPKQLTEILGDNQNIISQIKFTSLKLEFMGENQATATTNVDVEIKLTMPNLMYLQTVYSSTIKYEGQEIEYDYKVLDLLTYQFLEEQGNDIEIKKFQKGAKLFSPKFYRNHNRLTLKIAGTTNSNKPSVQNYIFSNDLILDLKLIDHTIKRNVAIGDDQKNDELTINYKGFIRSHLADPKYDVLRTPQELQGLIADEEKQIRKLSAKEITTREQKGEVISDIKEFTQAQSVTVKAQKSRFATNIFSKLQTNNMIWRFEYKPQEILLGNIVDGKIKNPKKVLQEINKIPAGFPKKVGNYTTDEIKEDNLASTHNLDYFYFGDLIYCLMDNIYDKDASAPDDKMKSEFERFPIKVLLPSYNPIVLKTPKSGNDYWDIDVEKVSNLSWFPIAVDFFNDWIKREVVEADVDFMSLGHMINKLINELMNGFFLDSCYAKGSQAYLRFGTKSDFSVFYQRAASKPQKNNKDMMNANSDFFSRIELGSMQAIPAADQNYSSVAVLDGQYAPFFLKSTDLQRSEHCNYLVVYQQSSVYDDFKDLSYDSQTRRELNIPSFSINSVDSLGASQGLTTSIEYSKAEGTYQREARFEIESLNSLTQLASVYNVKVDTSCIMMTVFPGSLLWVNPNLYNGPNVRGSVSNLLGMGGYHLVESVVHEANMAGSLLTNVKTTITANWIYHGESGGTKTAESRPKLPIIEDKLDEEQIRDHHHKGAGNVTEVIKPRQGYVDQRVGFLKRGEVFFDAAALALNITVQDGKKYYYIVPGRGNVPKKLSTWRGIAGNASGSSFIDGTIIDRQTGNKKKVKMIPVEQLKNQSGIIIK